MSMTVTLRAEKRTGQGKEAARKLRAKGRIPAVLYGKGTDTLHLSLETHEAELLFQSISVENTIIGLDIEGTQVPSLIREIQVHPYRPLVFHVDFLRIREGETLELEIPVHLIGTPVGVRMSGGVLQQNVHEVPVRCLPSAIPESIDVDVSHLDLGDAIHAADLVVAEGVEVLLESDQTICAVAVPRVVSEDTEEEAEAAAGGAEEEESESDTE